MTSHENRFKANVRNKRALSVGAVGLCFLAGYLWDGFNNVASPSRETLVAALLVAVGFELHAYLRGVRALSISEGGISLERSHGSKPIRLPWKALAGVEVLTTVTGPLWVFTTHDGDSIQWQQRGFEGDKRVALEQALILALEGRGISVRRPA